MLGSAATGVGAERGRPDATASALDLHKVDWATVTLPGSVCGAPRPIRLHHQPGLPAAAGTAFVTPIPRRWSGDAFYGKRGVTVDTGWNPVVFGNLAGDAGEIAALIVDCNNGGGTADGVLAYAWVIFSGRGDRLSVVGVVTAQAHHPPGELATTIEIAISPGKITSNEFWYFINDPLVGHWATTVWTYARGTLRPPGVPVLTGRPKNFH